jgi:hypothetical protein
MYNKRKLIIGSFLLAIFLLLGSALPGNNQCAYAISAGCAENGYKNWNGWYWNSDGQDCWCNERENVTNECSTTGGGGVGTDPEHQEG